MSQSPCIPLEGVVQLIAKITIVHSSKFLALLKRSRIYLALCLGSFCFSIQAAGNDALLWLAQKDGIKLYLFGTTHHAIAGLDGLPQHVVQALERSDVVLTEIYEFQGAQQPGLPKEFWSIVRDYKTNGFPISAEARERLMMLVKMNLISQQYLDSFLHTVPTGIFMTLRGEIIKGRTRLGHPLPWASFRFSDTGYDKMLVEKALSLGKVTLPLEDGRIPHFLWAKNCETEANHSIAIIGGIDAALNDEINYLTAVELTQLTVRGEFEALTKLDNTLIEKVPGAMLFRTCSVTPRNEMWVDRFSGVLSQFGIGKTYFLVGGFAHFKSDSDVKDESILGVLKRQGYVVERVLSSIE